jgi:hypothetical protein
VTVHVEAAPVQAPVQPEKIDEDAATAVSVTDDPAENSAEHHRLHQIPAGLDSTLPAPSPPRTTVSGRLGGRRKSTTFPTRSIEESTQEPEAQLLQSSQVTRNLPCASGATYGKI